MTVTASATDQETPVRMGRPGVTYGPAAATCFTSYDVPAAPAFRVSVEREEGLWFVRDRATGIFGSGEELSEAIADYRQALSEHLDVLERQPALSEDLEAQLTYLRSRLGAER